MQKIMQYLQEQAREANMEHTIELMKLAKEDSSPKAPQQSGQSNKKKPDAGGGKGKRKIKDK